MVFIVPIMALWLLVALWLFTPFLTALLICAAVVGCVYFFTQSRDGDAEDALSVWTPPATNPYVISHLDNNREMDHMEKMYDQFRSLQSGNISTANPLDKNKARTDRNATHHRASRYQSATRTTEVSRHYVDSAQDWEPEHNQGNDKSRKVAQSFTSASYSRNIMRDDAVRNILGWNALEVEERMRMLPVSSQQPRPRETALEIRQTCPNLTPAPTSEPTTSVPAGHSKNGQTAINWMADIYDKTRQLTNRFNDSFGTQEDWAAAITHMPVVGYMLQTRTRVTTITKWTSIGEDKVTPDFSAITSSELHMLRLKGKEFEALVALFERGARYLGERSEAANTHAQLRKANSFFQQWPSFLPMGPQQPIYPEYQARSAPPAAPQVDDRTQLCAAMNSIHGMKAEIVAAVQAQGDSPAALQAVFNNGKYQMFAATVNRTIFDILVWASTQGAPGQPDFQKLQLTDIRTYGLVDQQFDDLCQLLQLAAQHVGGQSLLDAQNTLMHAKQFFGQWLPAPLPGPVPQLLNANPLYNKSLADAQEQVRAWMSEIHDMTSLPVKLRNELKTTVMRENDWKQAVKDPQMQQYLADTRRNAGWIVDWAAPGDVWDKSKISPQDVDGRYRVKGWVFNNTIGLIKGGAEYGVPGLGETRGSLEALRMFHA